MSDLRKRRNGENMKSKEETEKEVFGPRLIRFPEKEYKIKLVKKRWYHKYFKRESRHTFGQLVLNICSDKKGNIFIECDEFKISG